MKLAQLPLIAAILIASLSTQALSASPEAQGATNVRVAIENYTFKAPTVTVTVGTDVVWKNLDDDPHTVTATDGSFDSNGLAQGDTFTHRFSKPGKYSYYCKVHPMMRGTIIVKESGS